MRDPRVDRMAENIVNYSCKIVPGDKVMIESQGDHNDDLVKALIRAIYAAGGMPFVYLRKMDIQRELLRRTRLNWATFPPRTWRNTPSCIRNPCWECVVKTASGA